MLRQCLCSCRGQLRAYSSASSSSLPPVELSFDLHPAPKAETSSAKPAAPLVILHGLYGSKQNWRSLSRGLAQRTCRDVYALDLRNHGSSPHNSETSYKAYASDIEAFVQQQKLSNIILMGHSMGGKVAMAHALSSPDAIERLIVVDMSPARGRISKEFALYIDGMRQVEAANVANKKEADVILQQFEPSLPVRQFLLTNLQRTDSDSPWRFRIPLDILQNSIDNIGDFPYEPMDGVTFEKPTLFIKGGDSKYINHHNIPTAEALFPQSKLEIIDGAGHWVHSEKPKEFVDLVTAFCA